LALPGELAPARWDWAKLGRGEIGNFCTVDRESLFVIDWADRKTGLAIGRLIMKRKGPGKPRATCISRLHEPKCENCTHPELKLRCLKPWLGGGSATGGSKGAPKTRIINGVATTSERFRSCLRARFLQSVIALSVISSASAADGFSAVGHNVIDSGLQHVVEQQRQEIRELRLRCAEDRLAALAKKNSDLKKSMKKLKQSNSAYTRHKREREAAARLPLLSDIDFDNQHDLRNSASRILKAIRAEAKGSAVRHRKLLLHISRRPEFKEALDVVPACAILLLDELKTQIPQLKMQGQASGGGAWKLYSGMFTALLPAKKFNIAAMSRYTTLSRKFITTCVERKRSLLADAGLDGLIFSALGNIRPAQAKEWKVKFPQTHTAMMEFWDSETQASPCQTYTAHAVGNYRINKQAHRRECIDPLKCCTENVKYQLHSDVAMFSKFTKSFTAIAGEETKASFYHFMQARSAFIKAASPRTCNCIYHSNFYSAFELYQKLVWKEHKDCQCSCSFCSTSGCDKDKHPAASADELSDALYCTPSPGVPFAKLKCLRSQCSQCGWIHRTIDSCLGNAAVHPGQVLWKERKAVAINTGQAAPVADETDEYGVYQRVKKALSLVTELVSISEFMTRFKEQCKSFFIHRELAHWQAKQFDANVHSLKPGHILILLDFSMNYS
jgi:hypothetical protein